MNLYRKTFDTALCKFTVISTDKYIISLCFEKDNYGDDWFNKYFKDAKMNGENDLCCLCEEEIRKYLAGKLKSFTVKSMLFGTDYQKKVWQTLKNIPYGSTISYGELTKMIGEGSPRTAGTALSKNPISIIYPCHRVVKSSGKLGGFAGGYELSRIKQELLSIEGLKVNP